METKEPRHGLATGACSPKMLMFGHVNYYCRCSKTFLGELSSIWSGVVEIDILQFSRCYILVSFRNKADIIVHYDNRPFCLHQ